MRTSEPGPHGQATPTPWRRWLLPLGGTAVILALLALPRGGPPGMMLSYTRFVGDVGAGTVRAVTIGPAGQVTGSLATVQPFTTTIPVALGDQTRPVTWLLTTSRSPPPPPRRPRYRWR